MGFRKKRRPLYRWVQEVFHKRNKCQLIFFICKDLWDLLLSPTFLCWTRSCLTIPFFPWTSFFSKTVATVFLRLLSFIPSLVEESLPILSGFAVLQSEEHSQFVDMVCVCVCIHFQPLIQAIMTKGVKIKSQNLKTLKFYWNSNQLFQNPLLT